MKNKDYYTVTGWMINDLKLSGTQLILYAIIYSFSRDGQSSFRGSLSYLEGATNMSKNAIRSALKQLCEKQILIRDDKELNGVVFPRYKANLDILETDGQTITANPKNDEIFIYTVNKAFEVFNQSGLYGNTFSKVKQAYEFTEEGLKAVFKKWCILNEGKGFQTQKHMINSFMKFSSSVHLGAFKDTIKAGKKSGSSKFTGIMEELLNEQNDEK